jgi:hypothetical protein
MPRIHLAFKILNTPSLIGNLVNSVSMMEEKEFTDHRNVAQTAKKRSTVKTVALVEDGEVDPLYQAKAQVLNDAISDIGMGRYQWHLFLVAGFGWFSDNV